jgi:hypothetical protein
VQVLGNEWGLSVIAVTVHVHYLWQRREAFVIAVAGVPGSGPVWPRRELHPRDPEAHDGRLIFKMVA